VPNLTKKGMLSLLGKGGGTGANLDLYVSGSFSRNPILGHFCFGTLVCEL